MGVFEVAEDDARIFKILRSKKFFCTGTLNLGSQNFFFSLGPKKVGKNSEKNSKKHCQISFFIFGHFLHHFGIFLFLCFILKHHGKFLRTKIGR